MSTMRFTLAGPRGTGVQDAIKDAIFTAGLKTTHWDESKGLLRFSLRFEVEGADESVKRFNAWYDELRRLNCP